MTYTFRARINPNFNSGRRVKVWITDLARRKDYVLSRSDFVKIEIIDAKENVILLDSQDLQTRESLGSGFYRIETIGDIFWSQLAMEASGIVQIEHNEPLKILQELSGKLLPQRHSSTDERDSEGLIEDDSDDDRYSSNEP